MKFKKAPSNRGLRRTYCAADEAELKIQKSPIKSGIKTPITEPDEYADAPSSSNRGLSPHRVNALKFKKAPSNRGLRHVHQSERRFTTFAKPEPAFNSKKPHQIGD
jgi:hypothetical protein